MHSALACQLSLPLSPSLSLSPSSSCSAISPDGLLCQCRDHRVWHGCRSTHGITTGIYTPSLFSIPPYSILHTPYSILSSLILPYTHTREVLFRSNSDWWGTVQGWMVDTSLHSWTWYGILFNFSFLFISKFLSGKDDFGFGFGGTGKKSYASQFDDYGEVSKGLTLLLLSSVLHLSPW